MFKSLKEKLTSWFKKPEEPKKEAQKKKIEKTPKKEKKEKLKKEKVKKVKPETRKVQDKPPSQTPIPAQVTPAQTLKEPQKQPSPIEQIQPQPVEKIEPTEQPVEEVEQPVEKKQGFFKRLFSKKEKLKTQKTPDESAQTLAHKELQTITQTLKEPQKQPSPITPAQTPAHKEPQTITQTPKESQEQSAPTTSTQITPQKHPAQVTTPPLQIEQIPLPAEEKTEAKENFFTKLASRLSTSTLNQEQFDELFPELEITLLENNVALEVVDQIHSRLSKDLVGIEVKKSKVHQTILSSLKETIESLLIEPPNLIQQINKKLTGPFVIIFVGINGSGKTTTIAKVAHLLKKHSISSVLAAADTFRAASIEQIKSHGKKLDLPVIASGYGSDPASVAFEARKYAEAHSIRAVLIDTAGRMYTKTNLIKEMEKIVRVSEPDLKIFVAESITGNDAVEQARTFNEAINIDGIVLTKADVDEKAGTILSVSQVTSKPIYFLGTGQDYEDLTPFTKKDVLKNLGLE